MRAKNLTAFESSQAELNQGLALLHTLVLATSGYLVVLERGNYDVGNDRRAARWLGGAMALGGVFVIVKAVEYRDQIAHGLTTGVNQFFDFYWLLTAVHLFHVLLGILVLAYMMLSVLVLFGAISFSL